MPAGISTLQHLGLSLGDYVLLGLLREEESLASQVLLKSGVTLEKARELVKQVLTEDQKTSKPESEQRGES